MNTISPSTLYKEEAFNYELTVKVIKAQNIHGTDVVTKPDCYVCLWLPTSLSDRKRTKTVWNSREPVWNEIFHFRIHSQVKNILELSMFDEDVGTSDDHLFTVSYDVGNVPLNENVVENFSLNKEFQEKLQVEFTLVVIPESQKKVTTNGVLVCPEMVALQVEVPKQNKAFFKNKTELALSVQGSFEGSHNIPLQPDSTSQLNSHETAVFHFSRDLGTELNASVCRVYSPFDVTFSSETENGSNETVIPLNLISPMENEINVQIPVKEEKPLDAQIRLNECPEKLDVRLGFDLCDKEKIFLQKRQRLVGNTLKKVLQLEEDLVGEEIPVVAVMATGGGVRAMTSLYSHLYGLQNMGLLDCVTYIASASGSTWTTTKLYEDPNWSQNNLSEAINNAKKHMTRSKINCFSVSKLKYYRKALQQAAQDGQKTSFTDLWGLILESMLNNKKNESKLSDQQAALENGQNPLPIYLAINVKQNKISTLDFKEWCEFTPYEVGLLKYGAFIRTEDFWSEFFMGRLMKKHPEPRICFLQGLWGNVFSLNLVDTWYLTTQVDTFWDTWIKDGIKDIDEENIRVRRESARTKTSLFTPASTLSDFCKGVLTNRPIDGEQHNFLRGLYLHKDYDQQPQFSIWKDSSLDTFPNTLTPLADNLCLVDAGYFINASFPPLLHQERKVDVIISFDYTLDTPLQAVEQTCNYCTTQGIGFPKVSLSEEERKTHKECYVFNDEDNDSCPTVLHFPLVNDTFQKFKEPGVLRSPEEMSDGDVDVTGAFSPYFLTNFTYSESDFDRLLKLTQYNLANNKELILDALRTAVQRRKARNRSSKIHQTQAQKKT
ncbi:cytosolic phospholipase A2 delta-like isoform X2 [Hyla sarda]|uniref:cytosolic phospholipase A2 delta-like isoform X2 n=1 Tax=Hyla sarda TaxID=327740 RepID=UPI0024C4544E|nr:cytosolic phospholipase A2 delta-like isoform X2 [Hyla sarda]XP_056403242.1 cytosolic phospholipase A2 delta-like isoform X2 [Hyla sarda]